MMTKSTVYFSPWQQEHVAEAVHIFKDQEVDSKIGSELRPNLEWSAPSAGLLPTAPHFLEDPQHPR